jgi:hypothetical protein
MKDAFKTKAKEAATEFSVETAKRMIKPTLLRQPVVARVFNSLPPRLRARALLRLASFGDCVYISVGLYDLESFRDTRLITLLDKFAGDGWKAGSSDWAEAAVPNRDYTFAHKFTWEHDTRAIAYKKLAKENQYIPQTFEINITISAWVKEDSPTCRIVTKEFEEVVKHVEKFIVCD